MTRVQLHRGPPPNATLSLAQLEQGFFGETGAVTNGVAFAADGGTMVESSSIATSGITPAQQAINYFTALPNQSTKRCVIGQYYAWGGGSGEPGGDGSSQNPFISINQLATDTGKVVGLVGVSLTFFLGSLNSVCATAWNGGAQLTGPGGLIITGIWSPNNPQSGGPSTDLTLAVHNAVTPGTTAYSNYQSELATEAAILNGVKSAVPGVVILYRPLREFNGNWNWWMTGLAGNSAADCAKLWQMTHDYMIAAGLGDTLVWDWNVNAVTGNYTLGYPGSSYADVVSFDYYGDNPATDCLSTYNSLLTLNKPLRWAEFGPHNSSGPIAANSFDNTVVLNACKHTFPKVFSVMYWHGWWAIDTQLNASNLVNDPIMATCLDVHAPSRFG